MTQIKLNIQVGLFGYQCQFCDLKRNNNYKYFTKISSVVKHIELNHKDELIQEED